MHCGFSPDLLSLCTLLTKLGEVKPVRKLDLLIIFPGTILPF
jgi:hypothetical protein